MQANNYIQIKKVQLKENTMKHWKYSYDCNQPFTNKPNFGIK